MLEIFVIQLIAAVLGLSPSPGQAQDARALVANLGQQAIQVLGPRVPAAQRLQRFRELFQRDFDMAAIGQFVLGRYWRTATPPEQQEFLRLFQEYTARAYSARLAEYAGEPFRVTGSRPGPDGAIVTSEIIRTNGAPVQVDWYLTSVGGQQKIIDVYVGGVSMKVTARDEFGSIIQRNGGRVEALLAQLRQKLAAG